MSLSFFRFLADLEQSTSQIRDAWSIDLKFPLMTTFNLKKLKTEPVKALFLPRNADLMKKC